MVSQAELISKVITLWFLVLSQLVLETVCVSLTYIQGCGLFTDTVDHWIVTVTQAQKIGQTRPLQCENRMLVVAAAGHQHGVGAGSENLSSSCGDVWTCLQQPRTLILLGLYLQFCT